MISQQGRLYKIYCQFTKFRIHEIFFNTSQFTQEVYTYKSRWILALNILNDYFFKKRICPSLQSRECYWISKMVDGQCLCSSLSFNISETKQVIKAADLYIIAADISVKILIDKQNTYILPYPKQLREKQNQTCLLHRQRRNSQRQSAPCCPWRNASLSQLVCSTLCLLWRTRHILCWLPKRLIFQPSHETNARHTAPSCHFVVYN